MTTPSDKYSPVMVPLYRVFEIIQHEAEGWRKQNCDPWANAVSALIPSLSAAFSTPLPECGAPCAWAIVEPGTNEVISAFPDEQAAISARPSMDHDTIPLYAAPLSTTGLIPDAELQEMLSRAEMAAEVTLPIEKFRDLVLQASRTT